jgi:hypothetical protein
MTLIGSGSAWAATLMGKVTNGTANTPASGDEVVLVTLSDEGMKEGARVKTDSEGRFVFNIADPGGSLLLRVLHQGVAYHSPVPLDGKLVRVMVYDAAAKIEGVSAVMDVQRFEATNETLEIKQLVTLHNNSKPPRTLTNERSFEIQLPIDAEVESGMVQVEDGPPLKRTMVPAEQKGRYYSSFPVRPGDTRFAVVYRLPYAGNLLMEPTIRDPLERFVVMLPKSMKFEPLAAGVFEPMPGTTPDHVEGTKPVKLGQTLAFRISGTGTLDELEGRREQAGGGQTVSEERSGGQTVTKELPGGGLGVPSDAPDPLQGYRWQILAGLGVLLLGGAYLVRKTQLAYAETNRPVVRQVPSGAPNSASRTHRKEGRGERVRATQKISH